MQVATEQRWKSAPWLEGMEQGLGRCVHCGFCNTTCPTYGLSAVESDGPRGRLYLIKSLLEGHELSDTSQEHLDRCLLCRSCMSTCPSGVPYAQIMNSAREHLLPVAQFTPKQWLVNLLLSPWLKRGAGLFRTVLGWLPLRRSYVFRPVRFAAPVTQAALDAPEIVLLSGCVEGSLLPQAEQAFTVIARSLGYRVHTLPIQCCSALPEHLGQNERAFHIAEANLKKLAPYLERGAKVLMTSSACQLALSEYPDKHPNAQQLAAQLIEPVAWIGAHAAQLKPLLRPQPEPLAIHSPCTLSHGLKNPSGLIDTLSALGFNPQAPDQAHLCCGSSGAYSLFHPEVAQPLKQAKLKALQATSAQHILTANVGCLLHLASDSPIKVSHWLVWLAQQVKGNTG